MTKVKVCGITNEEDAKYAVGMGYDFIGFIFHKDSPRNISVSSAKKITAAVGPLIKTVGVFVNEKPESILKTAKKCNLNFVQLHGDETPEYCQSLKGQLSENCHIIKSFRMKDDFDFVQMYKFESVDYFLLDTFIKEITGGTGQTFNWDLAVEGQKFGKPIFLSGGLTPENVSDAIEKVKPYAVDVSSGVERLPRRKDYDKLISFIKKVKFKKTI